MKLNKKGNDGIVAIIFIALFALALIFIPWLIGHATMFFVNRIGITNAMFDFWTEWLIGIALYVIGWAFKSATSDN